MRLESLLGDWLCGQMVESCRGESGWVWMRDGVFVLVRHGSHLRDALVEEE